MSDQTNDELIERLVDRFIAWPLPKTVASDLCVTDSQYPHQRSGTNLLTAIEARQMFEQIVMPEIAVKQAKIDALMLEYCPDEMTEAQTAEWAAHQIPAALRTLPDPALAELDAKREAAIEAMYQRISKGVHGGRDGLVADENCNDCKVLLDYDTANDNYRKSKGGV